MESKGTDDEDVYMRDLGESLVGSTRWWFDHLASRSINRYDLFTKLLIDEWCENIDESIQDQSNNDFVDEDQLDEDSHKNYDEVTKDYPYETQIFSPEPIMSMTLNDILSDPAIQENVIDYFSDDEPISDYDLDINLETQLSNNIFSFLSE